MALTPSQLAAAREWLLDCFPNQELEITDADVALIERNVAKHFEGGIAAFLETCDPEPVLKLGGDTWRTVTMDVGQDDDTPARDLAVLESHAAAAEALRVIASRCWNLAKSGRLPTNDAVMWPDEVLRWHQELHNVANLLDPAGQHPPRREPRLQTIKAGDLAKIRDEQKPGIRR